MADKKATLPTFDFNKRQRTAKLDILAEEQATIEQSEENEPEAQPTRQDEPPSAAATFVQVQQAKPPAIPTTTRHIDQGEEITRNRGGRPRATVQKVKKNYQLAATDLDNLDAAAIKLTSQARIRIKDDSSVIGLALAWLRETAENGDSAQLDRLIELYQNR